MQSPSSPTDSVKWFGKQNEKTTRDARKFNPLAIQKTPSFRYSVTSDHKPVFMEFDLEGITEPLVALTYNMSFASDLGRAIGSEANFVQRAIDANPSNPRAYWINAANLVAHFVNTKYPAIMYFQEMNDREMIKTFPPFEGGYQALLELLAKPDTIVYNNIRKSYSSQSNPALISYYTTGTYVGTYGQNYGFVAYSIKKTESYGDIYPTVLTIWNIDTLGGFSSFYGNDLGLHRNYYNPFHYGRNFSCVTTIKGANLINLHGPNSPADVDTKLKQAIENYMTEAATKFSPQQAQAQAKQPDKKFEYWNEALTVIGGDTNDTFDKMKIIKYRETIYNYAGSGPKSCCAEFFEIRGINDTIYKYRHSGDKIFVKIVKNPDINKPTYTNQLYIPSLGVAYGGRRRFNNLKQRKTIKKKHYKLKKKKSLKKRRSFRRKTTKHTH